MSDIFEETEETLRQEQWFKIAKTYGPWVGGALGTALVIALGIWGWTAWQDSIAYKASDTFQAGMEAATSGDKAKAKAKFDEVVKSGAPAYVAMADMELAAIAQSDGRTDDAIKLFDAAAKATGDARLADLATLKAAWLAMDRAPYGDMLKRLTPLTEKDRPYAPLAKEALAMAKLQSGDVKGARADLSLLSLSLDTPQALKFRAGMYVEAIDSGAAPIAKAAVALPEVKMSTLPVGAPGAAVPGVAAPGEMPVQP